MRFLRALAIALVTAVIGMFLSIFAADYLTRLYHVSNMEGERGMTIVFLFAPLGFVVGFAVGFGVTLRNRSSGLGFMKMQALSILITVALAAFVSGIAWLGGDRPPRIDGKPLRLYFELRVPAALNVPSGYSVRMNLYLDNKSDGYAFVDWRSISRDTEHITFQGNVEILTHSRRRSLLASIGNEPGNSQFIELNLPATPCKEDEKWSDWIMATEHADLSRVSDSERFALRYRIRAVD